MGHDRGCSSVGEHVNSLGVSDAPELPLDWSSSEGRAWVLAGSATWRLGSGRSTALCCGPGAGGGTGRGPWWTAPAERRGGGLLDSVQWTGRTGRRAAVHGGPRAGAGAVRAQGRPAGGGGAIGAARSSSRRRFEARGGEPRAPSGSA
ncbi:glycine-rich protein 1-like [Sorghum bicolor]|uniref:glycine-rich protein 1-like n=1 Tax=Sorghum bicolor TaxID=4558 RepID=UPI000B425F25|nr:glycine-rich protein 1-like [Sorghum bicolor]|eukprot:XP_021311765.1 glycine-rich protein 1-like [Sorghum bicolor]